MMIFRAEDGASISDFSVTTKGISVTDLCFSSKSTMIGFGCDDASVGILNMRIKEVEVILRDHDSGYAVRSVSINCVDSLIASASSDGELIVNALSFGEPGSEGLRVRRIFRDRSMHSPITMVRFSNTKRHILATAYENGTVAVWDLQ